MKVLEKNNGFTLIELLVTILIISIILGIGSYFVVQIINTSKTKSTNLALANIKTAAKIYSEEFSNEIIWKQDINETGKRFSCISIDELINKNFLKKDIKDNYNLPEYIIVSKNEDNVIISEEFDENAICNIVDDTNLITINYDANGGSGTIESDSINKNTNYTTKQNTFTRDGFEFLGWSTNSTDSTAQYQERDNFVVNESLTLYAIWKDTTPPVATLSTTSTLRSSTQTLTLTCNDNNTISHYYIGNSSTPKYQETSNNSSHYTNRAFITKIGTYYFSCKDSAGNVSNTVSQSYWKTTVYNMLLREGGTVSDFSYQSYDLISQYTVVMPISAPSVTYEINVADVYTRPAAASYYIGYHTTEPPISNPITTQVAFTYDKFPNVHTSLTNPTTFWFS